MTDKAKKTPGDSLFSAPYWTTREKKEFYSSLSHIFRGPLVGATGYVDYLFKGYAGALKPEQLKPLARVRESVLQLDSVIDTFLDIVAFDLGLIEPARESLDLAEKVGEICENLNDCLSEKKVAVSLNAQPGRLAVRIDPHWVKTMLYELTSNALLVRGRSKLNIRIKRKSGKAIISINGFTPAAGLEETRDIFRPFRQIECKMAPKDGRRGGLGLYLVKKIALVHKGRIYASKNNLCVNIELPLAR